METDPILSRDPFELFEELLHEAAATGMDNPEAMVVSTVDGEGRPSSRVLLLKGLDRGGFVFFTNLESRKALELDGHPDVCLNFYWRETEKQVRIEGLAEKVSDGEADAYFATRPRGSQIGAWASQQSRRLKDRDELLAAVAHEEQRFAGRDVPRPPHWGGYRVSPRRIEVWISGE
nr:pyridoxamine 5'-phosphate oxidase [Thermoanaerobaculia bacterium]